MASNTPSIVQLQRALKVSQQIEELQAELASILGTSSASAPTGKRKYTKKSDVEAPTGKRKYTKRATVVESEGADAANAVIASLLGKKKKSKKGKMSEEGRTAIVAAQKKRWAAKKKALRNIFLMAVPSAASQEAMTPVVRSRLSLYSN